jgi:hypothetical protein
LCGGWHRDPILGGHLAWDTSLANQYPTLYNIVRTKDILVADVLSRNSLNIRFNRMLVREKWDAWIHLVTRLMNIHLNDEPNRFKWHLTMYADCMNGHTVFLKKYLWKIKVPIKIRIFMWFLYNKVILTKDNLVKRHWTGCAKCVFVVLRRQLTIFLYLVPFLGWFGELFISPITYLLPLVSIIFLEIG